LGLSRLILMTNKEKIAVEYTLYRMRYDSCKLYDDNGHVNGWDFELDKFFSIDKVRKLGDSVWFECVRHTVDDLKGGIKYYKSRFKSKLDEKTYKNLIKDMKECINSLPSTLSNDLTYYYNTYRGYTYKRKV